MSGRAFGVGFGFDADDALALASLAHEGDSAGLADWLEAHIKSHRDMHAFFEYVGRAIYKTWPMAMTAGATLTEGDFWAMRAGPNASPAAAVSTQIITASLNGDWDNLTALIRATLTRPEEFHASVTAHLLKAFGDGLRAVTAKPTEPSADGKG